MLDILTFNFVYVLFSNKLIYINNVYDNSDHNFTIKYHIIMNLCIINLINLNK